MTEVTSTPTRPVENVVITTKGLQVINIQILDGTTVENKGKLSLMFQKKLYLKTSLLLLRTVLHFVPLYLKFPFDVHETFPIGDCNEKLLYTHNLLKVTCWVF